MTLKEKAEDLAKKIHLYKNTGRDVVLFTGGGFSKLFGYPLWREYVQELYSLIFAACKSRKIKEQIKDLEKLIEVDLPLAIDNLIALLENAGENGLAQKVQGNFFEKQIFKGGSKILKGVDKIMNEKELKKYVRAIFSMIVTTNFDTHLDDIVNKNIKDKTKKMKIAHIHGVLNSEKEWLMKAKANYLNQTKNNDVLEKLKESLPKDCITLVIGSNLIELGPLIMTRTMSDQVFALKKYEDRLKTSTKEASKIAYKKIGFNIIEINEYNEIIDFIWYIYQYIDWEKTNVINVKNSKLSELKEAIKTPESTRLTLKDIFRNEKAKEELIKKKMHPKWAQDILKDRNLIRECKLISVDVDEWIFKNLNIFEEISHNENIDIEVFKNLHFLGNWKTIDKYPVDTIIKLFGNLIQGYIFGINKKEKHLKNLEQASLKMLIENINGPRKDLLQRIYASTLNYFIHNYPDLSEKLALKIIKIDKQKLEMYYGSHLKLKLLDRMQKGSGFLENRLIAAQYILFKLSKEVPGISEKSRYFLENLINNSQINDNLDALESIIKNKKYLYDNKKYSILVDQWLTKTNLDRINNESKVVYFLELLVFWDKVDIKEKMVKKNIKNVEKCWTWYKRNLEINGEPLNVSYYYLYKSKKITKDELIKISYKELKHVETFMYPGDIEASWGNESKHLVEWFALTTNFVPTRESDILLIIKNFYKILETNENIVKIAIETWYDNRASFKWPDLNNLLSIFNYINPNIDFFWEALDHYKFNKELIKCKNNKRYNEYSLIHNVSIMAEECNLKSRDIIKLLENYDNPRCLIPIFLNFDWKKNQKAWDVFLKNQNNLLKNISYLRAILFKKLSFSKDELTNIWKNLKHLIPKKEEITDDFDFMHLDKKLSELISIGLLNKVFKWEEIKTNFGINYKYLIKETLSRHDLHKINLVDWNKIIKNKNIEWKEIIEKHIMHSRKENIESLVYVLQINKFKFKTQKDNNFNNEMMFMQKLLFSILKIFDKSGELLEPPLKADINNWIEKLFSYKKRELYNLFIFISVLIWLNKQKASNDGHSKKWSPWINELMELYEKISNGSNNMEYSLLKEMNGLNKPFSAITELFENLNNQSKEINTSNNLINNCFNEDYNLLFNLKSLDFSKYIEINKLKK